MPAGPRPSRSYATAFILPAAAVGAQNARRVSPQSLGGSSMRLFRVIVPVSDIDAAARFYEEPLGLSGMRCPADGITSTVRVRSWPYSVHVKTPTHGMPDLIRNRSTSQLTTLKRSKSERLGWTRGSTTLSPYSHGESVPSIFGIRTATACAWSINVPSLRVDGTAHRKVETPGRLANPATPQSSRRWETANQPSSAHR